MIQRAGQMNKIAQIVASQCAPYQPGAEEQGTLIANASSPLASRIIKAVNVYDEMIGEENDPGNVAGIIEILKLDTPGTYDPEVIDALERVLTG